MATSLAFLEQRDGGEGEEERRAKGEEEEEEEEDELKIRNVEDLPLLALELL